MSLCGSDYKVSEWLLCKINGCLVTCYIFCVVGLFEETANCVIYTDVNENNTPMHHIKMFKGYPLPKVIHWGTDIPLSLLTRYVTVYIYFSMS